MLDKHVSEQLGEDYYVFLPETAFAVIIPVSKCNMDKKEIKTVNRIISQRFNSSGSFLTDDTYIYRNSIGMLEKVKDDRLPTRAMLRR